MIMPDAPEPKYWKALLTMSLFCAPVIWSLIALAHTPAVPTIIIGGIVTLGAAYFVLDRMKNDWRASDTLAARHFDAYTGSRAQRGFKDRE